MFPNQHATNIFGFSNKNERSATFDKTASFFNPAKNERESSFSTQTTDITRGNSSQSTTHRASQKPALPLQISSPKHWVQSPYLAPLKSPSSLEQVHPERFPAVARNCISQETIRRKAEILKENCKPGTSGGSGEEGLYTTKSVAISKRIPFLHQGLQIYDPMPNQENELSPDRDQIPEAIDQRSDNVFRIRTHVQTTKGATTITKVNKIKVISTIPVAENPIPRAPLFKKNPLDIKNQKSDIKKKGALEIDIDEPKQVISVYNESRSVQAKVPSSFAFPLNTSTPKPRNFSPRAPPSIERNNRNLSQLSPVRKRVPTFLSKQDELSTLKDIQDLKTPCVEGNGLATKNFQSEKEKYMSVNRNNDSGSTPSPPVIRMTPSAHHAKRGFGTDLNIASSTECVDLKNQVRARGSLKFKNELAVLNKLFNPLGQSKKE